MPSASLNIMRAFRYASNAPDGLAGEVQHPDELFPWTFAQRVVERSGAYLTQQTGGVGEGELASV